jgi:Protein of unknown function (DUF559)
MHAWRYTELRRAGASRDKIRGAVSSGVLQRPCRGLYARPAGDRLGEVRALMRVLPTHAAVGYHTAAELFGFGVLRDSRIHVVVPAGMPFPDIRGIATHQAILPFAPVEVAGVPCVAAARCAVDLARVTRRLDALAVLDAALRCGAVHASGLAGEVSCHDGLRGVRQARELVPLADPRAECPQESHLRLLLLDNGLPVPEPQLWVRDERGDVRYRLDLGWREQRVGAEYDGASHLDRDRLRHDRDRHNWLVSQGWRVRYFTDRDLCRRPAYIVATMRAALGPARSPI